MANKKTCHYYWLLEPVKEKYEDDLHRTSAFNIEIEFENENYDFELFLDPKGEPSFARITIPSLTEEKIPDDFFPLFQALQEHLISVLRITYKPEAKLFPYSFWTFFDPEEPHKFSIGLKRVGNRKFDADYTKNVFVRTFSAREDIRLFIHGFDNYFPLQYRYLSFYKLLENRFKLKGEWKQAELEKFLARYKDKFREKGFKKKSENLIHELRDKCAHIKTGKKREEFGVTELNREESMEVRKVLPIMAEMCLDLLNETAAGNFYIGFGQNFDNLL